MAKLTTRKSRAPVTVRSAPKPAPAAPRVTLTPRSKPIAQLTSQILELNARVNRSDTSARVAIGALLGQVQELLGPSAWLEWLAGAVPFTPRTAQTYVHLHRWSEANPAHYPLLAPLGPSKLALLSRLPPKQLGQLLRRKVHAIPGTSNTRTLETLTVPELALVIAAFQGALPPTPLPAQKALHNYQRRVHALARATEALAAYDALPRETLHDLHEALLETAKALAEAFALEA